MLFFLKSFKIFEITYMFFSIYNFCFFFIKKNEKIINLTLCTYLHTSGM